MNYSITKTINGNWRLDHPNESSRAFGDILSAVEAALPKPYQFGPAEPVTAGMLAELAAQIIITPPVPAALVGWEPASNGYLRHTPSGYLGGGDWSRPQSAWPDEAEVAECAKYKAQLTDWLKANTPT